MGCADEAQRRMQQNVYTALGVKRSLMGTGFTKVTVAINKPTPLHVDGNNIGLSVSCAFDVTRTEDQLRGGSHVAFDGQGRFALLVEDSVEG
eukprot:3289557-Pleurochrysis_carterae.AAC.1